MKPLPGKSIAATRLNVPLTVILADSTIEMEVPS